MRKLFFTIPGMFFIFLFPLNAQVLDPVGWEISTEHVERNIFEVTFKASIEGKWHMYGMDIPPDGPVATSFTFDPSNDFNLSGDVKALTEPERKYDPSFDMEIEMHGDEAVFVQEIEVLRSVPFQVSGYIEYMSCDDHMCLPPKEKEFSIEIKPVAGVETNEEKKEIKKAPLGLGLSADDSAPPESIEHSEVIKEVDTLDAPLDVRATKDNVTTSAKNGSLWLFFWISFGAGLLGILTPCVFPMIPMTVSFFMRGSENRTNAVTKGVVFGISIIAIYTLIGVIVSLTSVGAEVTNQLSTHWIPNAVFFLLFLIFAASFLGMFELVLPSSLVNKADKQADRGGLIGAFFMAFTLVLVSFSCTGPIVGALLVEAAGGLAMKPILGMFGFSLAFALPFTLFAIFPSWLKGLPKSGGWLNAVKVVLGFIVLAFSLKFLSNIDQAYNLGVIPRDVFLAIWIVIIFLLGMYLLGKIKFSHDSDLPYLSVQRLMLFI
ncbi:MAG: cytochrome c biogenesis protein CcdA, partial [Bacteroidota bacterium]